MDCLGMRCCFLTSVCTRNHDEIRVLAAMKSNCKQVWYLTSMVGIWDSVIEPHGDLIVRKVVCAPEAILNRSRLWGFTFSIDTVDLFLGQRIILRFIAAPPDSSSFLLPFLPPSLPLLPSLPHSQQNSQPKQTKTNQNILLRSEFCCLLLGALKGCSGIAQDVGSMRLADFQQSCA